MGQLRTFNRLLRQQVYDLMLYVHHVSPGLAEYWVSEMDDEELNRRLEMYAKELNGK